MLYDFYAKGAYYKPGLTRWCRRRLHRVILRGLRIRSVLEVGVGLGELAEYCREAGILYTGVEPNQHLREVLIERGFSVLEGTMLDLPAIPGQQDAIFAGHVIEHLNGLPEALAFLDSCRQILDGNGRGLLVLLYPDITRRGSMFWCDYTHNFVTSKDRIEQMLIDHRWQVLRSGRYTACFFTSSTLASWLGRLVPTFLFPKRVGRFIRLSSQEHAYTVACCVRQAL